MSQKEKKSIPIPKSLTAEGQLQTQTEMLPIRQRNQQLFIGIPLELNAQENRIALVPSSVYTLVNQGHRVVIQAGAGKKSRYSDHEYSEGHFIHARAVFPFFSPGGSGRRKWCAVPPLALWP